MDRQQASKLIQDLMVISQERGASDLFITADFPPAIKVNGKLTKLSQRGFDEHQTMALARALMTDRQIATFEHTKECNFAVSANALGRFRANAHLTQGKVGLVLRRIPDHIPNLQALGLPPVLSQLAMAKRGICIVVGATGSGKSTTLAALIDHRNQHSYGHIVTVEDPVEFIHTHKNCIVTQREIGIDTEDWASALKNSLRQAPDVILMGEIRDKESMEHAIAISNTGHLCLATLHANSCNSAIDRIIDFFPEIRKAQVLQDLSMNLVGMIGQRLVNMQDTEGRALASEIMFNTPFISDLIAKGQVGEIKGVMKKGRAQGMQTFDQSLFELFETSVISYSEALRYADSVNDLRLLIKTESNRAKSSDFNEGTEKLHLM